jgi:putative FmdB family regulatory protein
MPTYEFRCPEGHDFEKFYRSIGAAEARATCPVCGQAAERVMSATGFAFKGSGFYLTDYGKNAHREKGTPEPKSGAPAGESAGSDGAKSEPKASDAPATAPSSAPAGDKKKADAKPAEPKPSVAAPKKSTGE